MAEWRWEQVFVYIPEPPRSDSRWGPIAALYREHLAGGKMHIVTDDFNVDDDSLGHCNPKTEAERAVFDALLPLSPAERWACVTKGTYAEGEDYSEPDDG